MFRYFHQLVLVAMDFKKLDINVLSQMKLLNVDKYTMIE